MYLLLLALTFLSFSPSAWPGGETSGGGYVLACKEQDKTTYTFLDFYEGEQIIRDFEFIDLPAGENDFDIARAVIERIKRFSPQLAKEWQQTVTDFQTHDTKYVTNATIKDIQDDEMLFKAPENCTPIQAAVQVKDPAENQYRLYIDGQLWKKLDLRTRVGLLVHEAIYKMAMQQGHTKSVLFRPLNALLFSKNLDGTTDAELARLFQKAELDSCFVKNFEFTSPADGSIVAKFQMQLKIKSFKMEKNSKDLKGESCESQSIHNFFKEGTLRYQPNAVVNVKEREFCIEDPAQPAMNYFGWKENYVSLYKRMGTENVRMEDGLCFTTLPNNGLTQVKVSPILPTFYLYNALTFDKCHHQVFHNGDLKFCGVTSAKVTVENNPPFELVTFEKLDALYKFHVYEIKESSRRISLGGAPFEVGEKLTMAPEFPIVFNAPNKVQKISVNGVECRLHAHDRILFDQNGKFQAIIPKLYNEGEVLHADSCSKLFQ